MSVGLCQSAAKGKGKGERNTKKNRLMKVTQIGFLGVRNFGLFCFFAFFSFLVSGFLGFLFSGSLLVF